MKSPRGPVSVYAIVFAFVVTVAAPAGAETSQTPRTGMLTSMFGYERLAPSRSTIAQSQSAFVGQVGYAYRALPSGLFVGGSMEFNFVASLPANGGGNRNALGLALHAGWDIGAATNVLLDGYVAPAVTLAQVGPSADAGRLGLIGGLTLAVPWTSKWFSSLGAGGEDDGVTTLLAFALVLLPNSVGLRAERLSGDDGIRFGALVGWSIPLALWQH